MKTILIWDWPTRVLHWGLATSVTGTFVLAFAGGDGGPWFRLHRVFGLIAVGFVLLRMVWGVVGSRHARFSHFPLSPAALASYVADAVRRRPTNFPGLNPGAAWAGVAMLALVGALAATGLAGGEPFEDMHGVLAYLLLGVIGAHLAGLALHTLRHRDWLVTSMITGKGWGDARDEISSARPVLGGVLLLAALAWIGALFRNYDRQSGTIRLPVIGATVQGGENERGERGAGGEREGQAQERGGRHGADDDD